MIKLLFYEFNERCWSIICSFIKRWKPFIFVIYNGFACYRRRCQRTRSRHWMFKWWVFKYFLLDEQEDNLRICWTASKTPMFIANLNPMPRLILKLLNFIKVDIKYIFSTWAVEVQGQEHWGVSNTATSHRKKLMVNTATPHKDSTKYRQYIVMYKETEFC